MDRRTQGRVVAVVASGMLAVGFGASLGFLPGYYADAVKEDLGISRAQVGLLVSLHFGCTGVGSILGARITERIGVRSAVVADQLVVAAAAWMSALVGSYTALLVAAVFAGFGYALANAATNEAVAAAVPATQRTLALSLKTAGVPTMALLCSALVPWAADQWSWNVTVMAVGTMALISAIMAATTLHVESPVTQEAAQTSRQAPARLPMPRLPSGFWWFSVASFFLVGASQPLYSWLVPYLDEAVGLSKPTAGAIAAVASGIGVVAMIGSALHADRVGPRRRVPLIVALTTLLTLAMGVIVGGFALNIWVVAAAMVGAFIGTAAQLAAIGTMHAAAVDRAPNSVVRATGVMMTGYYLGALAAPVGFGALVDWLGTYSWAWVAMVAASAAAAVAFVRVNRVGASSL